MIPSLAGHNDEREALVIVHVAVLWFLPTVLEAERLASTIDTRKLVEADGIEPTTSCLQSRRSPN